MGIKDDIEAQTLFEEELNAVRTLKRDPINEKTNLEEAISAADDEIDAHSEEKADRAADVEKADHELKLAMGTLPNPLNPLALILPADMVKLENATPFGAYNRRCPFGHFKVVFEATSW